MFGKKKAQKMKKVSAPPEGVSELILCVFNEKRKVKHWFDATQADATAPIPFGALIEPARAFDNPVFQEMVGSKQSCSMSISSADGISNTLYVLPFEYKRGKSHIACLQIAVERSDPDRVLSASVTAFCEGRVCLLICDHENAICVASDKVPEAFGFSSAGLKGLNLSQVFGPGDIKIITSCSADTNESILSCIFHCKDGARRDVEIRKYSVADDRFLYAVSDVTRQQLNEEITAVSTRERRRIGQDLHDSIGQLLTGISLLSRSLANGLKKDGHSGHEDAAQISELADDASNQIRQISRGLMPADIVHRGLFPSLRELARITTDSCSVQCEAILDDAILFSDGAVETHLFRIAQEAVNNAVRHSGGNRIEISITEVNELPQLEIKDNGRWRNIMENSGGIGMKTMQYRASVINGQLNIAKDPQGGTRVVCRLEEELFVETKVF